ncbi:MAG TPA: hypothetical protein ENN19_17640 [Chloroflexi bacterium]|nr:hypothetical protein [Chloroflexota bacterium]
MKKQTIYYKIALALILLTAILAGCGDKLPKEAKDVIFDAFEPENKPSFASVTLVEPLAEDIEAGFEEVWCVNITFNCWSCSHGEYRTCADSRLVRRSGDQWDVKVIFSEEDKEKWQARGCEFMPDLVSGYGH